MKTHFIDIFEELKSTRSSWKIKLIVGAVCKYDGDNRNVETEIFIQSVKETTIMLETDSDVFFYDTIKSFRKEHNDIDKQMEGSGFSFKFQSLSARYDKVNVPKGSSYIESPKWLRYKNSTINPKPIVDRCFQYAFALTQHH